jgi:hypothetical protein
MVSKEKLQNFLTYDYVGYTKDDGSTSWLRTGNIVKFSDVNYYGQFDAVTESTLPSGYIIPAVYKNIAQHLQKLGVKVEQLQKNQFYTGEVFMVETLKKSERKFEGHFMATAEGKFSAATRKFKKGDYIVALDQPLVNLIFYMLEPQSDDGLVTWNFFDETLRAAGANNKLVEYPVFKYYKK